MVRNDETLEVTTYANRLPDDLTDRQCFVLDPMLATGHTLIASCEYLHDRGARDITCVTLLCAPEGLRSEEHTSELQSRGHLVCRLLLEKTKIQASSDCRCH